MSIKPKDLQTAQAAIKALEALFKHYAAIKSTGKLDIHGNGVWLNDFLAFDDSTSIREIVLDSLRLAIECKIDDLAFLNVDVEGYHVRIPELRVTELADVSEAYGGCVEKRDQLERYEEEKTENVAAVALFATPVGG